ncbi:MULTISPECIES: hypothetical protein [Marichromatium]|uniref:Uncharacterized protein n=1 Tax=Marichromatium gracile TaxID=1048 RepID=A0A4V2W9K9_MARGR|nr:MULTISPECIES: hypothetical protein [Marichromatium]MBK1708159.1 hypothetical protein [Marichromatium gracile]RNE89606.1 hypothetical protein EBL84_10545 [Marichromatium sp. AB31]TCW35840.1 hypothetical protein EDC29_10514 [Marichromatium gracile]
MTESAWYIRLGAYPYAQPFLIDWQIADHGRDPFWSRFEEALERYLDSHDSARPVAERYQALTEAMARFVQLRAEGDGHLATRMVLIRILFDLGERQRAGGEVAGLLQGMTWLTEPIPDDLQIHVNRPLVAPMPSFDQRPVKGDLGLWLQAALIETLECTKADSSYFHNDLQLFKLLLANPNHSLEMERRQRLLATRLGIALGSPEVPAADRDLRPERNSEVWSLLRAPT